MLAEILRKELFCTLHICKCILLYWEWIARKKSHFITVKISHKTVCTHFLYDSLTCQNNLVAHSR